ncbi:MAG TPA: sulfite exporter TauE/SafE family protein [Pseudomonadales bacterium]
MMFETLVSAFLIGLASSGHCLVMCGGIASALSSNIDQQQGHRRLLTLLLFHGGRILCYTLLGLVVGDLLRTALHGSPQLMFSSRLVAAGLLVLIGLYIAGINTVIKHIESRMAFVWRALQPAIRRFMPIRRFRDALVLGFFWGFLPCGIIYSTLLWASTSVDGHSAAVLMFFFGLGTIPALLSSNIVLQRFITGRSKKVIGLLMIGFGLWTAASLLMGHGKHQHQPASQTTGQPAIEQHKHHSHHGH